MDPSSKTELKSYHVTPSENSISYVQTWSG